MTTMIKAIGTYNMTAMNGRHIRVATKVELTNGATIRFMEKMSKKDAIANAMHAVSRTTNNL